eukprot:scaffold131274_cov48-Phaeocystis_antarctica.AAC.1
MSTHPIHDGAWFSGILSCALPSAQYSAPCWDYPRWASYYSYTYCAVLGAAVLGAAVLGAAVLGSAAVVRLQAPAGPHAARAAAEATRGRHHRGPL